MHSFWWECHAHLLGFQIFQFKQNILFAGIITKVFNSLVIFIIHVLLQHLSIPEFIFFLWIIKTIGINIEHLASIIWFAKTKQVIMLWCISHKNATGVWWDNICHCPAVWVFWTTMVALSDNTINRDVVFCHWPAFREAWNQFQLSVFENLKYLQEHHISIVHETQALYLEHTWDHFSFIWYSAWYLLPSITWCESSLSINRLREITLNFEFLNLQLPLDL